MFRVLGFRAWEGLATLSLSLPLPLSLSCLCWLEWFACAVSAQALHNAAWHALPGARIRAGGYQDRKTLECQHG